MTGEALLAHQNVLLRVARESIVYGLAHDEPLPVELHDYAPPLREPRASFVTLEIAHQLRGCIGTLEAIRPLVDDVSHNAFAAAFEDPRFAPLSAAELPRLDIHISVLSVPEDFPVGSEAELLAALRPGVDGLIIEDKGHRSTFLPAVWEQLPDPRAFVRHLKRKAGFAEDYWSDTLTVKRYHALKLPA